MTNTYTRIKNNKSRKTIRRPDNLTAALNQLVVNYNRKIRTVQGEAKKQEREAKEKIKTSQVDDRQNQKTNSSTENETVRIRI